MARRLIQELHQTKPFESPGVEAMLNILKTASQLQLHLAQQLKPFGVSHEQYNVLRILKGAGPGGCTCQEIADRLISHNPDITRLLDKLVKKKFVSRRRDTKDRRVVITRVAKKGETLLEQVRERNFRPDNELLGHMKKRELTQLIDLLERVREKWD